MRKAAIFPAWGRILRGYKPFLSIEVTKQCPLRCPGCYAYEPKHLSDGRSLRTVKECQGDELVERVLDLVRHLRPLHVSFVGGEPLMRHRELTALIPRLGQMGVETQIITSASRLIPTEWASAHLVVSVDGLQPEHDVRRAPATYPLILRHIAGHDVIIHCTIIPQMLKRREYLEEFARTWSARPEVRKIWFSLFTAQAGQYPPERLTPLEREAAIDRIARLRHKIPKVYAPDAVLHGYRHPPQSPSECIFARTTTCVSADLSTTVTPCQIGGLPKCGECGCIAAAGLIAIGRIKLAGIVKLSSLLALSTRLGERMSEAGSHGTS